METKKLAKNIARIDMEHDIAEAAIGKKIKNICENRINKPLRTVKTWLETNLLDEIDERGNIISLPSQKHPQVKELADRIGKYTSPQTISSRLKLLTCKEG